MILSIVRHLFDVHSIAAVFRYAAFITVIANVASAALILLIRGSSASVDDFRLGYSVSTLLAPLLGVMGGFRNLRTFRLSQELSRLVNRDRLTDVATRDFFFERLAADPDTYGVSLMIDIDHFKKVNDTHGHLVGDDVIARVGRVLKDEMREDDIVCRFGGEEFLVYLRDATRADGWEIAERIRERIAAEVITTRNGPVEVTVSVGGSLKVQLEKIEEAIRRADDCLYRAKAMGRNRTVVEWRDDRKPKAQNSQAA